MSVSDAEVEREFRRRNEQVKLEYVLADAARFRAAVQPTEDEIKARFEAKKDAYRIPEKRVVSYVLLDRATLQPQVAVTDRDIELYYQDHREEFRQEEEACASHILVKVKAGDAGEGHPDAEAQAIAQGLLDQVKAGRRLRGDREEVLRGPGLGPERRRPRLLPAGPHGARVRRRGLRARSRARSPTSSRPRSATTSSASPRSASRRCCRSPR